MDRKKSMCMGTNTKPITGTHGSKRRASLAYQAMASNNRRGTLHIVGEPTSDGLATTARRRGTLHASHDHRNGFLQLGADTRRASLHPMVNYISQRRVSVAHNSERADQNWQRTRVKATAIANFGKHIGKRRSRRESLMNFLHGMKSQEQLIVPERSGVSDVDEQGDIVLHVPEVSARKQSVFKPGIQCALCLEMFPVFKEHEAIPCRVCSDVFHRSCLDNCRDLHPADVKCLRKAKTHEGWSCPKCANLTLLLTQEDVDDLVNDFQEIDDDEDARLSLDELIKYHTSKKTHSGDGGDATLTASERALLVVEFKTMDQDGDGMVDWWEFINHESKRHLSTKPKQELVSHLTRKELSAARAQFDVLDKNKDGRIKASEVRDFYKRRFEPLQKGPHKSKIRTNEDLDMMELYASIGSKMILDATSMDKNGYVTWSEFIGKQALGILSARPNCFNPTVRM